MKKQGFFMAAILLLVTGAKAQVQFSGWLASFNAFQLDRHFSLHFDAQLRSTDQWAQLGTVLLRPGLTYRPNKNWVLTAGYAAVFGRRNLNGLSSLLTEHRIWQQVFLNTGSRRITVSQRLRFEERFLPQPVVINNELKAARHDHAYRLRYFLRSLVPLTGSNRFTQGLFLALQNEIFLNTGDKTAVNGKAFDQNRLYGAIGYRFRGKMDLEAGYLNQYTVTRSSFLNNHILQLAVYKRL